MRVAHLADIHIRNNDRHEEYNFVFNRLNESLNQTKPDLVVVSGDIFHSKTVLSPESVHMFFEFIGAIPSHIPIIMIVGNHDASLSSKGDRLDAISPLIPKIEREGKVIYSKNTESFHFLGHTFFHYSCLDNDPIMDDVFQTAVGKKILLYHGQIGGATNFVGHTFDDSHQDSRIDFGRFDVGFLGDIHQYSEPKPNHFYPSSLICQNHGEHPLDHGYLLWDLSKDTKPEYVRIQNDWGYFTVRVRDLDFDPELVGFDSYSQITPNAEVRIQYARGLEKNAVFSLVKPHLPSTVTVVEDTITEVVVDGKSVSIRQDIMDLHNPQSQEKLFREYFEAYPEDIVEDLVKLNKKIGNLCGDKIESGMTKHRFKLLSVEFSNLFSYGEGNKVDFTQISGVCGNFAKNATGKTSFLNVIPFAIYGEFPNMGTLDSAMNDQSDSFDVEVWLSLGTSKYQITRSGKRTKRGATQKLEFIEHKSDGTTVNHTDEVKLTQKAINNLFGNLDSYVKSSYMAQRGAPMFLDLTPAPRKEWFNKNLGLEFFSVLNDMAKKESDDLRSKINTLKNVDFVGNELSILGEINTHSDELKELSDRQGEVKSVLEQIEALRAKMITLPVVVPTDPTPLKQALQYQLDELNSSMVPFTSGQKLSDALGRLEEEFKQQRVNIEASIARLKAESLTLEDSEHIVKMRDKMKSIKEKGVNEKVELEKATAELALMTNPAINYEQDLLTCGEELKALLYRQTELENSISIKRRNLTRLTEESTILETDPRFTKEELCKSCPLLKNALDSLKEKKELQEELEGLEKEHSELPAQIEPLREVHRKLTEGLAVFTKLQNDVTRLTEQQATLKAEFLTTKEHLERILGDTTRIHQDKIAQEELKLSTLSEMLEGRKIVETQSIENEKNSLQNRINAKNQEIEELSVRIKEYTKYLVDVEQNRKVREQITALNETIADREELEQKISDLKIKIEVCRHRLSENEAKRQEYEETLRDYKVYELYLQATDKGGVPFLYVQKIIQNLEDEVNVILSTIVDFKVSLSAEQDKIECSLHSPSKGNWRSDLLSGMETFMVNLAFRLGIAEIANISQPNFMVVDEGFGVLDSDHVSETPRLFSLLKSKLDFILMVSHNVTMQDYVDRQLTITRRGGKSYISL